MAETAKPPTTKSPLPSGGDHDRVVMASRNADGTPDQTADFTYIGDKDVSIEASRTQLAQQAASATDIELRGWSAPTDEAGEPDPAVAELKDAIDSAAESAADKAEAEVEARFEEAVPLTPPGTPKPDTTDSKPRGK